MKKALIVIFVLIALGCGIVACDYFAPDEGMQKLPVLPPVEKEEVTPEVFVPANDIYLPIPLYISDIEKTIIEAGLVDVKSLDSSIVIDLKYSTANNFLGLDIYGDFNRCYLQPDVAQKLVCAQKALKSKFPFYSLIVFDAVRARSIQRKMWDTINVPYSERSKYVSNPNNGSLHNFGAAVDISIVDERGFELDMGTAYDYFGELAYPREEERMLEEGKLTHIQLLNRTLLREVMESSGFMGITTEWWHFNSCFRTEAYEKYKIIE